MIPTEIVKKQLEFNFSKVALKLDVSQSLFSSFDVDVGSKALLNSLRKNDKLNFSKILDLGCGYGLLGLFLKKQDEKRAIHLTDRDALAVEFAKHNADLNNLDVKVYPSLDYENVKGKFSLIITNFPAKISETGMEHFIHGASQYLEQSRVVSFEVYKIIEGGMLAIVVVKELEKTADKILSSGDINIQYKENKRGHIIYHVSFVQPLPVRSNPYVRGEFEFRDMKLSAAQSLPEFDTPSYGTLALERLLQKVKVKSVFVLEPGQGIGTVLVSKVLQLKKIAIQSRDLLALKYAELNLGKNSKAKPNIIHNPFLNETPEEDLIIWNIQSKNDLDLNRYNLKFLKNKQCIFYGETKLIKNLLKQEPHEIIDEIVKKNHSAILVKL